jgi:hypothetical protein
MFAGLPKPIDLIEKEPCLTYTDCQTTRIEVLLDRLHGRLLVIRDSSRIGIDLNFLAHGFSFLQTIQAANFVYKPAILVENRILTILLGERIPQLDDSHVSILDRKAAPFGDLIVYVLVAHGFSFSLRSS